TTSQSTFAIWSPTDWKPLEIMRCEKPTRSVDFTFAPQQSPSFWKGGESCMVEYCVPSTVTAKPRSHAALCHALRTMPIAPSKPGAGFSMTFSAPACAAEVVTVPHVFTYFFVRGNQ